MLTVVQHVFSILLVHTLYSRIPLIWHPWDQTSIGLSYVLDYLTVPK